VSHIALRITPQDYAPPAIIGRMRSIAMMVGVIGAVGALICAFVSWNIFLRAWLVGFLFWLGLTTGSLCLLMLQYTSGGNWGRLGRRIWEAAASNLWLMFLLWLPLALGMKSIFPWAQYKTQADAVADLGDKAKYYLNPAGFWLRGIVFFAVWGFLLWYLR
jgi:hypothetical protein